MTDKRTQRQHVHLEYLGMEQSLQLSEGTPERLSFCLRGYPATCSLASVYSTESRVFLFETAVKSYHTWSPVNKSTALIAAALSSTEVSIHIIQHLGCSLLHCFMANVHTWCTKWPSKLDWRVLTVLMIQQWLHRVLRCLDLFGFPGRFSIKFCKMTH